MPASQPSHFGSTQPWRITTEAPSKKIAAGQLISSEKIMVSNASRVRGVSSDTAARMSSYASAAQNDSATSPVAG